MADEKAVAKKKGLHGWKAAAAVFGCGTLAAFGVFSVIAGLVSTFLTTLSEGVDSDSSSSTSAQTTTAPRDEFLEDKFDFCDIIMSISAVNVSLTTDVGRPVDTSIDGGEPTDDDLVRSDDCSGIIRPNGTSSEPWGFSFSYRSIIYAPEGDRDELSRGDFEEWREETEGSNVGFEESGESSMGDEAHYYYGNSEPGVGTSYALVARKRSAVFMISMSSEDEISSSHFANEVSKFETRLDNDFEQFIPAQG